MEAVTNFIFLGCKITVASEYSHETKRRLLFGRKAMTKLNRVKKKKKKTKQGIKKQRCHFDNKGPYSENYGFSSSHVQMWELDHKEGWAPKNWCFWTVVLEKTLESPLDCKEIKPANPKGNQPWIFTGRTDAEAEALATWCEEPTHWKRSWCWERLKAKTEEGGKGGNC